MNPETGEWVFHAPGHQKIADEAAQAQEARAAALAAEPGDGPETYEDRKEMIPHPWSGFFRAVWLGPQMPPVNLPGELQHFLALQIDRLGFRPHGEYQLEFYEEPDGQQISTNPGTWVPRDEYFAKRSRKMSAPAEEESAVPDFTDMSPADLNALEQAIRKEKIRQSKIQHADLQAKVAMGVAEMPELPVLGSRRTPPAPRPAPSQSTRPVAGGPR